MPQKRAFWEKMQPTSAEKIWTAAQQHLRSLLSGDTYNLWFAPVRASSQENNSIVLEVANDFCEVWLKDNYLGLLQDAIALASGRQLEIQFKVGSTPSAAPVVAAAGPSKSKAAEAVSERPELNF